MMNRKLNQKLIRAFSFSLFLIFSAQTTFLFAQREITYDPYAPKLKHPKAMDLKAAERRDHIQLFARILEQPIRPVGYGIGRTAQWVEKEHLSQKTVWFFDKLSEHGVILQPKMPTTGSLGAVGLETRIELEKLFNWDQPYVSTALFAGWTPNKDFAGSTVDLGADYKIEIPKTRIFQEGVASYSRSSAESFYGIGQDTSLGDYSTYQPEETKLENFLGYRLTQTTDAATSFVYQKMNIGNGNRDRVGKIKEHFRAFPGINGGDLIGVTSSLNHDNRDHKNDPKRGGYEGVGFSYYHDADENNFQYFKVSASASHYVPIFSDRRIFAVKVVGEKNQELGSGQIPFFNLARLGGSTVSSGSELLRSFDFNRFLDQGLLVMNTEYRYNVYEYGDFAGDAFTLFDVGEVFKEFHDIEFKALKFSVGGGFNVKFRRYTFFSISIARGNEGWRAGTHTKISF